MTSVNGPISHGSNYPNGASGDTGTPGLIDEVGGFHGISTTPLGGDEFLLFSVLFTADLTGQVNFASNPADESPM